MSCAADISCHHAIGRYQAGADNEDAAKAEETEEETTASRFVTKLLKHLLSGMEAKDKNVRFRVTLLTVSMINGLGEMECVYIASVCCAHSTIREFSTAC